MEMLILNMTLCAVQLYYFIMTTVFFIGITGPAAECNIHQGISTAVSDSKLNLV